MRRANVAELNWDCGLRVRRRLNGLCVGPPPGHSFSGRERQQPAQGGAPMAAQREEAGTAQIARALSSRYCHPAEASGNAGSGDAAVAPARP